eukprot:3535339-Prymnesium_polylepis.1
MAARGGALALRCGGGGGGGSESAAAASRSRALSAHDAELPRALGQTPSPLSSARVARRSPAEREGAAAERVPRGVMHTAARPSNLTLRS